MVAQIRLLSARGSHKGTYTLFAVPKRRQDRVFGRLRDEAQKGRSVHMKEHSCLSLKVGLPEHTGSVSENDHQVPRRRRTVSDPFHEPKVGIHKVYTRGGDKGETSLVGGQRVPKDDGRIDAYGTVDELNAIVGLVCVELDTAGVMPEVQASLLRVQHALFNLGGALATQLDDRRPDAPAIRPEDVARLETEMDEANESLPALTSFVLPGGSRLNALLHLARTVCRRAERAAVSLLRAGGCTELDVQYLNRLSDAFFVWSRQSAHALGHDEVLWAPNKA